MERFCFHLTLDGPRWTKIKLLLVVLDPAPGSKVGEGPDRVELELGKGSCSRYISESEEL